MVPFLHCVVLTLHVIVLLSHSMVSLFIFLIFDGTILTLCSTNITYDCILPYLVIPLFFFSHLIVLSSYCAVPISDVVVLHTSSVQVGNLCAQLFANSICSLLTASCLSFSSDPKKIQNISLFHQTFVYG